MRIVTVSSPRDAQERVHGRPFGAGGLRQVGTAARRKGEAENQPAGGAQKPSSGERGHGPGSINRAPGSGKAASGLSRTLRRAGTAKIAFLHEKRPLRRHSLCKTDGYREDAAMRQSNQNDRGNRGRPRHVDEDRTGRYEAYRGGPEPDPEREARGFPPRDWDDWDEFPRRAAEPWPDQEREYEGRRSFGGEDCDYEMGRRTRGWEDQGQARQGGMTRRPEYLGKGPKGYTAVRRADQGSRQRPTVRGLPRRERDRGHGRQRRGDLDRIRSRQEQPSVGGGSRRRGLRGQGRRESTEGEARGRGRLQELLVAEHFQRPLVERRL